MTQDTRLHPKARILFQLSGSIACFKACSVISKLVQEGHEVQTVCSEGATRFIGEATLEGLTGKTVLSSIFEKGRQMDHIHLMKWADLIVLCPASANTLNALAAGRADGLVGALFLAHDFQKPYLVFPAMNTGMYAHPATQNSLRTLQAWGVRLFETESGNLACGDHGEGRLLDTEKILTEIHLALRQARSASPHEKPLRVLVTSGGARETIDQVRFITNSSTGKTGAAIADHFSSHGHYVTYVHAKQAAEPRWPAIKIPFLSFQDLDSTLKMVLEKNDFDLVVHAAAVSDFSVDSIEEGGGKRMSPLDVGKIPSKKQVVLHLKQNHKIVEKLKTYARNPRFKLVAFKLTSTRNAQEADHAVREIADKEDVDFVVHNDLSEIDQKSNAHRTRIYRRGDLVAQCSTKLELAETLERLAREMKPGEGETHDLDS